MEAFSAEVTRAIKQKETHIVSNDPVNNLGSAAVGCFCDLP